MSMQTVVLSALQAVVLPALQAVVLPALQAVPLLDEPVGRILLAGALGLFLGLEREWSQRSAGIRTFSLIALLGAVFAVVGANDLLVVGAVLVVLLGVVLAIRGLIHDDEGLSLTTAVSMLVAYGAGVLVGQQFFIEGVTVAILSSLLLVLKRELHDFAWGLSHEELRSAIEFGVLAFVIYPILPDRPVAVPATQIQIEPRLVWLLVVTVAGIGIVNYAIVKSYDGRGIAVTGFFAGLASSTAVVGTMLDHVRQNPDATSYAVAAILLADAAMALRNLAIVLAFTFPDPQIAMLAVPLGILVVGSAAIAFTTADWRERIDIDLDNPFSMRNALVFGALFAVVLTGSALATTYYGGRGLIVASALSGLVSSGSATTSAVVLYASGEITAQTTILAVTVASLASIIVKAALTATSPTRSFSYRVALWSGGLVAGTGLASLALFIGT